MKALIVGASGLCGQSLWRSLEENGFEVAGTYFSRPLAGCQPLNVTKAADVERVVSSVKPNVIFIVTNSKGGVDYNESHPEETKTLFVDGTKNIVKAAKKNNGIVVAYSTDYLFDGKNGPYSEDAAPTPISVYGKSKLEAENIVKAGDKRNLIVRTSAVYGWDRMSSNMAMSVFENLQAGKSLQIPGDQWCNPTQVDFLSETVIRLVQAGASGVYNVVGRDRVTKAELAKSLAKTMLLDPGMIAAVPTAELGKAAPRPLNGGLKFEKLAAFVGTEPQNLGESLKRFQRHWRSDTHIRHAAPVGMFSEAQQLKQEILDKVSRYYELVHKPKAFVPQKSRVQYAGRVFGPEEMVNLVDSSLDFWLTFGSWGDMFERKMKKFLGCKDFVTVNSGSTANLTAIMSLQSEQVEGHLKPGDEVITPAVTFPTTLAPIVHGGMIPVFVDCEVGTYNINAHLIEDAISPKTRAMMIPHTLGNPIDLDIICDIAKRHNLFLVEDSCDALGATFNGQLVGTFGDLATLSFYPAHHMTMGEGGAVIVNKAKLSRVVRSVRDWGRDCWCAPGESNTCGKRFGWSLGDLPKGYDHKYVYSNIGYNFKTTDMQAAIGVAQADRVEGFIEARRRNFNLLYKGLEQYQDYLILPTKDPRANPSWFGLPLTVKNGLSAASLAQWLESGNIETRQVFSGNILKQPGYQSIKARISGSLEQTDRIMADTFFIGVYPGINDEMIDYVLKRFADFFAKVKLSSHA